VFVYRASLYFSLSDRIFCGEPASKKPGQTAELLHRMGLGVRR